MKGKNEVFDKFKEFKALVENLFQNKIKIFRLANGGEFTGGEFKSFCTRLGLKGSSLLPTILNRMV